MKLNEKALDMTDEGKVIYNLSGGQLPIKPLPEFIEKVHHQLNFLKSYQYSPVSGFPNVRKKLTRYISDARGLPTETFENEASSRLYFTTGFISSFTVCRSLCHIRNWV
jgi:aspartate aminotransferase